MEKKEEADFATSCKNSCGLPCSAWATHKSAIRRVHSSGEPGYNLVTYIFRKLSSS